MSDDKNQPGYPLFLTAKVLAIMDKISVVAAQGRLKRYKKNHKIPAGQKVVTKEYYEKKGAHEKHFSRYYPDKFLLLFIKYTAAAAILISCSTRFIDYPKLWDTMKIKWLKSTPDYRKGIIYIKDEKTGEERPLLVEVKNADQ